MTRNQKGRQIMKTVSWEEWKAEGVKLFGKDITDWRFKCPGCNNTQTMKEFINLGMDKAEAATRFYYSCIGRWDKSQGCDYTSGGLINIAPIKVIRGDEEFHVFEFAEEENKVEPGKFIKGKEGE